MAAKVIFLGNGLLAEKALAVLERECQILCRARRKEDLPEVVKLKKEHPEAKAVLASFGVMIPEEVLEAFEPEGILNIHPSPLPKYRGPSPIESAMIDGAVDFSVSVMKLAPAMDAGPVYHQETFRGLPLDKEAIYTRLAEAGAEWIVQNLADLPEPKEQEEAEATYTTKLTKEMGVLEPEKDPAELVLRKIAAYAGYPRAKYAFWGVSCTVWKAHMLKTGEEAGLTIKCADGALVAVDEVQPEGRKRMDAKSFLNGYKK